MTREEAVNVLKNTTLILGRVNGKMALAEALQMAITALQTDGDCISRQDAITIPVLPKEHRKYQTMNLDDAYELGWFDCQKCIEELPSVQAELSTEIQEILDYLDTTLHPIVSPDNWYVYSELHDMISRLPSVQPEPCEDTISRADAIRVASGYCHPANVAKELAKLPSAQPEPKWIPCSETVDIPDHEIMACDKYGELMFGYLAYEDEQWICASDGCEMVDTIAWREKPEPYREEGE